MREDVTVTKLIITLVDAALPGQLEMPTPPRGLVIFAHGSGSSRLSPRNTAVARVLRAAGLATLLFDLLTEREDAVHAARFDIALLTRRLIGVTQWMARYAATGELPIGYFGASTGSAAALNAAAELGGAVRAVVSRGGRPDLALEALPRVQAPTLLIVGGADTEVITLNRAAYARLIAPKELAIIPSATHLFEEPGTLDEVARLAAAWFTRHLAPREEPRG